MIFRDLIPGGTRVKTHWFFGYTPDNEVYVL
jgi:hypothetical protein